MSKSPFDSLKAKHGEAQPEIRKGAISIKESSGPPDHLFSAGQRVLTVGDGDLTFSLALSNWFWHLKESKEGKKKRSKVQAPIDIVVTSYDTLAELDEMYKPCIQHTIKCLASNKCKLFTEIDATTIAQEKVRSVLDPEKTGFDRVVWNFPHGGFPETDEHHHGPGFEWSEDFSKKHASIVRGFVFQAKELLRPGGLVIITNKSIEPFNLWNIPKMAMDAGFTRII